MVADSPVGMVFPIHKGIAVFYDTSIATYFLVAEISHNGPHNMDNFHANRGST